MGYAAAMSFILFMVIAAVTFVNARLLRYDIGYQRPAPGILAPFAASPANHSMNGRSQNG